MKPYLFKSISKFSMVIPTVIIMLMAGHALASEPDAAAAYTPEECIECHRTGSDSERIAGTAFFRDRADRRGAVG